MELIIPNMNNIIELIANVVTILGFPFSVFLIIKELKSNNKSINKLADSIKNLQIINADKIENVNMTNSEVPEESSTKK